MHIVAIAWIFVVVLMAAAEATAPQGTLLGAFFTLLLYGALPLSIVLYVLNTPHRRRGRKQREAELEAAARADAAEALSREAGARATSGAQRDGGGEPPGAPIAPVREEP